MATPKEVTVTEVSTDEATDPKEADGDATEAPAPETTPLASDDDEESGQ